MACKFLIYDIVSKIRLLTVIQKEPYLLFKNILGYYPKNIGIYQLALRHKSSSIIGKDGKSLNNERLEFLGDAVLNVLVSDILFRHYGEQTEGFLSKTRSRIVRRENLNKIALQLDLDKHIIASTSCDTPHLSIYGNALEALIGAIYIDQGYRRCKQFLEKRIFDQFIDIETVATSDGNFKSILLEWSQHNKKSLKFITEDAMNDVLKSPSFHARAIIENKEIADGYGFSKKEAQQNAAKKAIEILKKYSTD